MVPASPNKYIPAYSSAVEHWGGDDAPIIHNVYGDDAERVVKRYMEGQCAAFAQALHDLTGWPMLAAWVPEELAEPGDRDHPNHVGVLYPPGEEIVDVCGRQDFGVWSEMWGSVQAVPFAHMPGVDSDAAVEDARMLLKALGHDPCDN